MTVENFAARLAQANLATKSDSANFVDKTDFDEKMRNLNKKITSNKTKHLVVENEFKELQIFDSNLFNGQSYFNNDGTQIFLIFQPIYKTISPYKANKTLSPKLIWMSNSKIRLRFKGSCLKQDKASFTSNNVVNLHIVMN